MKTVFALLALLAVSSCGADDPTAMDTDTIFRFESAAPVPETMDRLEAAVRAQGLTVFARIDHAANAQSAGLSLDPSQVLIFGNAKAGTQLMNVNPDIALDLPLRILVRADGDGSTIRMYDPASIATRYRIRTLDALLGKMRGIVQGVAKEAGGDVV